ncbi:hypothetical protein SLS64_010225 [Diaporthe eres]|uniref:Cytochrome P450 n=1 Tax=Diaporthe eres TaxID=83184 RepID=A0ABR1PBQ9_DIAER
MSQPIPQPKGLPLVGNILDVKPSNTWQSLQRLSEKHGEIFQIKVLGKTIVFVAGAALAEELCDEKRFRKYVGGPIVEIRRAVHDALFTAFDHEENWGIKHRIVAPRLTPDAVREWCGEVVGCTGELIAKWKGLGESSGGVDLMDELNRLNLEATTLTMFGKKLNCITAAESHSMLQGMEDSTSEAMMRPTRPGFLNWLFYGSKFKKSIKAMREDYAEDLVFHRKQNPTGRRDILWALMEGQDDQTSKSLTEEQVIDEIVSMPIGSSTAPCLIGSEIYLLLQNKECITKARAELDKVVGPWSAAAGETTQIRAEHLPQLKYIEGIVRESLRLSFAAPGFNIEPVPRPKGPSGDADKSPVLLAGGKYQIAHDQAMILVLAGVNRDPAVFDDPLAFRPERMMGQSFEDLPPGVKKWFGNGKRECIGKHWAWQFNMVVTAMLIRECDFEMVDPHFKLDGHQDGWFNYRPVGFKVRVKPRAS